MELIALIVIFLLLNLVGAIGDSKPVRKYYDDIHGTNQREDT